jgi:lysylphosphatidylglycerol synthetase-like protein (DUF2156 family)
MKLRSWLRRQVKVHRDFAVQFLGVLVSLHGLYIVAATLLVQLGVHRFTHLSDLTVDLPLLVGLSMLYLGTLLRRRKRTAWLVTIVAYAFYLGLSASQLINHARLDETLPHSLIRNILLPVVVLGLLLIFQKEYVVKSDIQGFGFAARFSVIILLVAFIYGVAGFLLMDHSDFHQEIGLATAAHYTVDQFHWTTAKPLTPYTKRAHLFVDSLSVVSLGALAYAALSLFQPIRVRFVSQDAEREHLKQLLQKYGGHSEEFFKLWPHDKQYLFDPSGESGLAFHVTRGVALCLSDPVGSPKHFNSLMRYFGDDCFGNDWLPAMIHVEESNRRLYEKYGFTMQKLGQEAVVNLSHFKDEVIGGKYFRQINNRFTKQGYTSELLDPPHLLI